MLAESKATFRGTRYLRNAAVKVAAQFRATIRANPEAVGVVVGLVDLVRHWVAFIGADADFLRGERRERWAAWDILPK